MIFSLSLNNFLNDAYAGPTALQASYGPSHWLHHDQLVCSPHPTLVRSYAHTSKYSGGILSTWIFTTPPFHEATSINLGLSVGIAASCLANVAYLMARNKQKARLRNEHMGQESGPVGTGDTGNGMMDDRDSRFIYTL